jgi:uncharacterized protein YcbK (DUF882 family)
VAIALASILAAVPVARTTSADLPVPRASGHATRKERPLADALPQTNSDKGEDEAASDDELDRAPALETWATLFNVHTGEAIPLSSAEPSFARFSDTLSDRTTASKKSLDPRLLELLRQVALRNPGARLELVSGYRSPKLNEMLRKKGHRVASHSQHSLGHAVDFRIIGKTPAEMKKEILKVGWEGGIGQYDGPSDLFVHADVGPKREWFEPKR